MIVSFQVDYIGSIDPQGKTIELDCFMSERQRLGVIRAILGQVPVREALDILTRMEKEITE